MSFYWIDGDISGKDKYVVTYSVTIGGIVGGQIYSGQTTFIVLRPTFTLTGTLTNNPYPVDAGDTGYGRTELHFGTGGTLYAPILRYNMEQ